MTMLSKSSNPSVSIVLPTYNQADYLPKALDSILAQTWEDYELIVVNDGSTDGTRKILDTYRESYGFHVIHQENKKLPNALNVGFSHARGKYLTWTSSDNIMLPNMLEVLVNSLETMPRIGMVYADWEYCDDQDVVLSIVRTLDFDRHLLMRSNYIMGCFLYRRECQEKIGLYDPEYILAEDWEYWWRLSQYFRVKRVPKVLYRYRIHGKSLTTTDVYSQENRVSIGYMKLSKDFRARPFEWFISKIKWEMVVLKSGGNPLRIPPNVSKVM